VSLEAGLRIIDPEASPYAVVATQGIWDEEAVVRLLARDHVSYVGLIASPTRAGVLRAWLREEGVPEERIAALQAPAGMDIGAETPEEVALSILAELVQVRRGRAPFVAMPGPATLAGAPADRPDSAQPTADDIVLLDPVCGMTVDRASARHLAEHDGVVYAFCRMGCRTAFIREPAAYVGAATPVQP
jgi:xanthine dehydrogenase accessory factor